MSDAKTQVREYHRLTKHSFKGYAPSPGFLDWDSQPDPFRRYIGAPEVELPLVTSSSTVAYADLYETDIEPQALNKRSLALYLELAFGLSAWKTTGMESWSLRHNPSSGNLHPTEVYVLLWRRLDDTLPPGLYHYAPHSHALEQRALLQPAAADEMSALHPSSMGALCFSSVHWREEWKYGARALRYCQHDVGHALASARYAAGILGWGLRMSTQLGDDQLASVMGLVRDWGDAEPETPDVAAVLGAGAAHDLATEIDWAYLAEQLTEWRGEPNQLSAEHAYWPHISRVLPALKKPAAGDALLAPMDAPSARLSLNCVAPNAERIIRQRRSAQRMMLGEGTTLADFVRLLTLCMPRAQRAPFDIFPYAPAVNLLIFVHQVGELAPGLYMLVRSDELLEDLKANCHTEGLLWQPVEQVPDLPLFALSAGQDMRKTASQLSCYQGIAGHSAFSLGMLAPLDTVMDAEGAWAYRRLFWEAGILGQLLYLEAGAANLSGTGIGCYFDDHVHDLLGLAHEGNWQSLYHFTVGKAREDQRLTTLSGYHHLTREREPFHEPVTS